MQQLTLLLQPGTAKAGGRFSYPSGIPGARGRRIAAVAGVAAGVLCAAAPASAYPWPIRPFDKPHAIRGAFDDPRFHLDAEGQFSAFHFGVDIAAPDGTKVYAVAPGYVHSRRTDVTVSGRGGRAFGYWHIRPVVHTGQHVRRHQLVGFVGRGWGHLHFAEAVDGEYRNPLRPWALTPFFDHIPPTVASIGLVSPDGAAVNTSRVRGSVDVEAEVYDTPPVIPKPPWEVARLTPAFIWWRLLRGTEALGDWNLAVDFHFALMPASLYNWIYASGSYQNKAHRPGRYLFWIAHGLDTTSLADGAYRLQIIAEDTRSNVGSGTLDFTVANGAQPVAPSLAPGVWTRFLRAF
jgi:murein DD-endopeptidase MepM/ murein hydrolase activator NlpD